jgi:hypothetical protein
VKESELESEVLKIEESRVGVKAFVYRLHSPGLQHQVLQTQLTSNTVKKQPQSHML